MALFKIEFKPSEFNLSENNIGELLSKKSCGANGSNQNKEDTKIDFFSNYKVRRPLCCLVDDVTLEDSSSTDECCMHQYNQFVKETQVC